MKNELLLRLPEEEVTSLYQTGQIGDEDVLEYTGVKHLEQGGHYLDLDTDQVITLGTRGHLTEEQINKYVDFQESPGKFYAKDLAYGIARGPIEAMDEVAQRLHGLAAWLVPDMTSKFDNQTKSGGGGGWGDEEKPYEAQVTESILPNEPDTALGKAGEDITQFFTGFGASWTPAQKIMNLGKLAKLSQHAPKFAKFIAGQLASLGATAGFTDLWEERLSNLIAEGSEKRAEQQWNDIDFDNPMPAVPTSTWLDPLVNALKAEEDDSGPLAAFKAVMEDQLLGAFGEAGMEIAKGMTLATKALWAQIRVKHLGNPDAVADEIREVATRIAERQNIVDSEFHPTNQSWEPPPAAPVETSEHTSGITRTVKRKVNDPERWIYVAEEEAPLPPQRSPLDEAVTDLVRGIELDTHEEYNLLLDIVNDDAVKKKFSVPRVTKRQVDEITDPDKLFGSTVDTEAEALAQKLGLEIDESPWKDNVLQAIADEVGASKEEVEGALRWAKELGVELKPDKFSQMNPEKLEARLREAWEKKHVSSSPKPEVSPTGEKQYVGYITTDQGQLIPAIKGKTPEEVERRLKVIKTNRQTATLYTKPFEKEGFTFEKFRNAVGGDQSIVDILSDTSVYRVESNRLAPGDVTPNVQMAKLKPLPEVKVELQDAHVQARETAQVQRAVDAHGAIPIRDSNVPQSADEAVELLMQDRVYRKQVAEAARQAEQMGLPYDDQGIVKPTLQLTEEELPEITATILQLAKGPLDMEHVADYKLLMEDGFKLTGLTGREMRQFAGVNLLKVMSPENSKQIIAYLYQTLKTRIAEAGGGGRVRMVVTDEEAIKRLSSWTGVKDAYGMFRTLKQATDDLPVAMRAAEIYFAAYSELLGKFAQKATTMEDKLMVQEMGATFVELFSILKGSKANLGRAVNIQKMNKGGDRYGFHLLDPEYVTDLYKEVGASADAVTEAIANLAKNPKAVAQFVRKYHGIRIVDGIVELMLSSMLSSPATWAKNVFGTLGRMVHEEFNMDTALVLQGFQNRDIELMKEPLRRLKAQGIAMIDAFRSPKNIEDVCLALREGKGLERIKGGFWKTLRTGDNVLDPVPKFEHGNHIPNIMGLPTGDAIRVGFHVLSASDEVMQTVGYMGALRANAIQEGLSRGLKGKDLVKFAAEMVDKPSREFHRRALYDSRWMVFKQNLDGWQKRAHELLHNLHNTNPGTKVISPLLRATFIPFDKVVFNVLNAVNEAGPFAPFTKKFRSDWNAGGIKRKSAMVRWATGMGMMYMGAELYASGKLRGATAYRDKGTAQALHMPDNAWFNDSTGEWETLTGLDPGAMYFLIGANIAHFYDSVAHMDPETENKGQAAFTHGLALLGEAVAYAPGMQGAHDLLKIIFDPGGSNTAGNLVVKTSGNLMPLGGMQRYASNLTQDPEYKQLGNAWNDWQNIMNGLWNQYWNKEGMLPRRHILFGDRTEKFEGYTFWGGQQREMMIDQSLLEIADIHMAVDRMEDTITVNGATKKLTPEQMDRAMEHLSTIEAAPGVKGLRGVLNMVVEDPRYQSLKRPEDRQRVLRNVISKFRSAAKKMVFVEDPNLQADIIGKLQQRMGEQMGILSVPDDHGTLTHNLHQYLQGRLEDGD